MPAQEPFVPVALSAPFTANAHYIGEPDEKEFVLRISVPAARLTELGLMDLAEANMAMEAASFWQKSAQGNVKKEMEELRQHLVNSLGKKPPIQMHIPRQYTLKYYWKRRELKKWLAATRCATGGHKLHLVENEQATYKAYDIMCKRCGQQIAGLTVSNVT